MEYEDTFEDGRELKTFEANSVSRRETNSMWQGLGSVASDIMKT
jgi:hypothetical protein